MSDSGSDLIKFESDDAEVWHSSKFVNTLPQDTFTAVSLLVPSPAQGRLIVHAVDFLKELMLSYIL